MERRVHTDMAAYVQDDDDFDPNEAYARMQAQDDSPTDLGQDEDEQRPDYNNYKGIYFNDDPGQKYQDPETGAHFEYRDMCRRLNTLIKVQQRKQEAELYQNLHTEPPARELPLQTLKAESLVRHSQIEEPIFKTLQPNRKSGSQATLPFASGGGTGGTRNFLSTGASQPRKPDSVRDMLNQYNNLSTYEQKQLLQKAMRSKGLSSGQDPSLARYYKGGSLRSAAAQGTGAGGAYGELTKTERIKKKPMSGTEARVHTEANDHGGDFYLKTESKELLQLYQDKKRNLGVSSRMSAMRKSGEPLKSRNSQYVRGAASHGPGKPSSSYGSRSQNVKSYAVLDQMNYKHTMGLKHGASKGSLQGAGPGAGAGAAVQKKQPKLYSYRGRGWGDDTGTAGTSLGHYPTSSASQVQSALFSQYTKPKVTAESRLSDKRKSSQPTRGSADSYSSSAKQQTRKKPDSGAMVKRTTPLDKFSRSSYGR